MTVFTVSEIAEKILRPDEDIDAVVNRLRNWTKEGLLDPEGEKNPGTGTKRLYSENSIIDALVLSVLTEQVGIPAVRTRNFKKIWEVRRTAYLLDSPQQPYLIIGMSKNDIWVNRSTHEGIAGGFSRKHDVHIVIDMNRLR